MVPSPGVTRSFFALFCLCVTRKSAEASSGLLALPTASYLAQQPLWNVDAPLTHSDDRDGVESVEAAETDNLGNISHIVTQQTENDNSELLAFREVLSGGLADNEVRHVADVSSKFDHNMPDVASSADALVGTNGTGIHVPNFQHKAFAHSATKPATPILRFTVKPATCRVTPSTFDSVQTTFYLVLCPSAGTDAILIDFDDPTVVPPPVAQGPQPLPAAKVCDASGSSLLHHTSRLSVGNSEVLQLHTCGAKDAAGPGVLHYTLEVRRQSTPASHQIQFLGLSRVENGTDKLFPLHRDVPINVTLYSHEPVTIAAQSPLPYMVTSAPPFPVRGATDGHVVLEYIPKVPEGARDEVTLHVSDGTQDLRSYRVSVNTVKSTSPYLVRLNVSPGRLEPAFSPHIYSYHARIPVETSHLTLTFDGMNDRDTRCSVNRKGFAPAKAGRADVYLSGHADAVIVVDCLAADPTFSVRYVLITVPQYGGSTLLSRLDPVGADLSPIFNSLENGPYSVDLGRKDQVDTSWMAFFVETVNPKAVVSINGEIVDVSKGLTPYYRLRAGQNRSFKIGVRTHENIVEEEYFVTVRRPAHGIRSWTSAKHWGDFVGWASTIVSSYGSAASVMTNLKMLQFLSLTHWLNSNPESYDVFSSRMMKWNLQLTQPRRNLYIKKMPTGVVNISNFAFNSSMPAQEYSEFVRNVEAAASKESVLTFNKMEEAARSIARDSLLEGVDPRDVEVATQRVLEQELWGQVGEAARLDAEALANNEEAISPPRLLANALLSPERVLRPVTAAERYELVRRLDAEDKQRQKLLVYSSSVVGTTLGLAVAAVGYLAVWSLHLRSTRSFWLIRQDYLTWLHPTKFWTFLLDLCIISYTQAFAALLLFGQKDTVISMWGGDISVRNLLLATGFLLLGIPLFVISAGITVLKKIQKECAWSRSLNRYHDKRCLEGSARHQRFKWLPACIGQFFSYEVVGVLPLCRPADQEGDSQVVFRDDPFVGGPWDRSDPEAAAVASTHHPPGVRRHDQQRGGYESLVSDENIGALQHDEINDRVRVQLLEVDPDAGVWEPYEINNDKSLRSHPEAAVAYESFRMKNAYDMSLEVEVEVQLKHFPKIVQTTENYTMWMPYNNLRMNHVGVWGQLFSKAPRGNFFHWAIDRLSTCLIVFVLTAWLDVDGFRQKMLFATASIVLAAAYLPSSVSTAAGKWFKTMQLEVFRFEMEQRKKRSKAQALQTWPFDDRAARGKFFKDKRRETKLWCGLYGFVDAYVTEPLRFVVEHPVRRTRAYLTVVEVLQGPVFSEIMKACILTELVLGGRYVGLLSESSAADSAIFLTCIALISMNWTELGRAAVDVKQMADTSCAALRRSATAVLAATRDYKDTQKRVDHITTTLTRAVRGEKNVFMSYPGRPHHVTVRDHKVQKVDIIQNELGLHFSGVVRCDKSLLDRMRTSYAARNRGAIYKTLYTAGSFGATRIDVDQSLPMHLSFKQYYCRRQDLPQSNVSRLAATIQIVNHSSLRFPFSKIKRVTSEDDSFFSLFTDPRLVAPQSNIEIRKKHGYAVHYNPELHQIRIKGPNIRRGRNYTAATAGLRPQKHRIRERRDSLDSISADDTKSSSSAGSLVLDGHSEGRATALCTSAGRLTVTVPQGQTPNLYLPFQVTDPSGHSTIINPQQIHVTYSPLKKLLFLSSECLLPSSLTYTVAWKTCDKVVPVSGGGLCHENGVVTIQLNQRGMPDLKSVITIRDEANLAVVVDPSQTDSYHSIIPHRSHSGFASAMQQAAAASRFASQTLGVGQPKPVFFPQTVPCTVVQCVDPVNGMMRVEPNFPAVVRVISAIIQENTAMLNYVKQPKSLSHLFDSGILSRAEVTKIYSSKGINLEDEGRIINPFVEPQHFLLRGKPVEAAETLLRIELERKLRDRVAKLHASMREIKEWAKAYSDHALLAALHNRDVAENGNTTEENLMYLISKLRDLKKPYENNLPGFVFPMNVATKLLCKKPQHRAQLHQWEKQVVRWLTEEEVAGTPANASVVPARVKYVASDLLRALESNLYKSEDLTTGQFNSTLHYIIDSYTLRGRDVNWKPDPLCTTNARVRVFRTLPGGEPDYKNPEWMPCLIKMTANSLKILMPAHRDPDREFPKAPNAPWRHISGYYVPLRCFEKVDVSHDPLSPVEKDALEMSGCVDTKLVFRKNQQTFIDDRYIRRIEDDYFDNELHVAMNADLSSHTENFETYSFMIGHCVGSEIAKSWAQSEIDTSIRSHDGKLNVHPLTIRCGGSMLERWQDLINMTQMNRRPKEPDLQFDGMIRRASVSTELTPPPPTLPPPPPVRTPSVSVSSSTSEMISESVSEEIAAAPRAVESAHYDGYFVNNRYHGKGKLTDKYGKVVYDGMWANGMRWGEGKCNFLSKDGSEWRFSGNFVQDDIAGSGSLQLVDPHRLQALKVSEAPADRWTIVSYKGVFRPPRYLRANRKMSDPPIASPPRIATDLLKRVILEGQGEYVRSDSLDSSVDGNKVSLLVDPRRAMSTVGDEHTMNQKMGHLGEVAGDTFDVYRGNRKASSASSFSSESSADHEAIVEEYLPHRSRWLRIMDPNLGYEMVPSRFTSGVITYANGATYEGKLVNGLPSGNGFYCCAKPQIKYDGRWRKGMPDGRGVMEWTKGKVQYKYVGGFKAGKRSGQGAVRSHSGQRYIEGEFKDDAFFGGPNCLLHTDGAANAQNPLRRYVGPMADGNFEGSGQVKFADGSSFKGNFSKSQRAGRGVMMQEDGTVVAAGTWADDMPHGRMTKVMMAGGGIYCGDMSKGARSGMGELFAANKGGILYEGFWARDLPNGRGAYRAKDGLYEGDWKDGKRQGKGNFTYSELPTSTGRQRVYNGDWRNDKQNGKGEYLNEFGIEVRYKFADGELDGTWAKSQKGLCASAPKTGTSTKVEAATFTPSPDKHWGSKKKLTTAGTASLIADTTDRNVWHGFDASKFEYAEEVVERGARPSRAPLTRPQTEGAGRKAGAQDSVICVTLTAAKALRLAADGDSVFARVRLGDRSKECARQIASSGNADFKSANLRFFGDKKNPKHKTVVVQLWSARDSRSTLLGTGRADIATIISGSQKSAAHTVQLKDKAKAAAGTVEINVSAVEFTQTLSSGSNSSSASPLLESVASKNYGQSVSGSCLKVEVHSASGLHQLVPDQSPSCRVTVGGVSAEVPPHRKGGRSPKWSTSHSFPIPIGHRRVQIKVEHEGTVLGEGEVLLAPGTSTFSDEIKLTRNSDGRRVAAGSVLLSVTVHN